MPHIWRTVLVANGLERGLELLNDMCKVFKAFLDGFYKVIGSGISFGS